MDDILAFGQSFEHAFDNLKCVFDRIMCTVFRRAYKVFQFITPSGRGL